MQKQSWHRRASLKCLQDIDAEAEPYSEGAAKYHFTCELRDKIAGLVSRRNRLQDPAWCFPPAHKVPGQKLACMHKPDMFNQ